MATDVLIGAWRKVCPVDGSKTPLYALPVDGPLIPLTGDQVRILMAYLRCPIRRGGIDGRIASAYSPTN